MRTAPASSALRDARSRSLRRHPCCRSTSSTTAAAESERIATASAIPSTPEARARCAALLRRFGLKWAAEFKLLRSPLMGAAGFCLGVVVLWDGSGYNGRGGEVGALWPLGSPCLLFFRLL